MYAIGMLISYARVSSQGQSLDRQIGALNAAKSDKVFREVASGKTIKGRPQLARAIDALGAGDILVIAEWDRATRSMMGGIGIIQCVADRSATVKVLDKPWRDLTTPMGKGILAFLSALAENERERITRRANEARQIALAKGTKFERCSHHNFETTIMASFNKLHNEISRAAVCASSNFVK